MTEKKGPKEKSNSKIEELKNRVEILENKIEELSSILNKQDFINEKVRSMSHMLERRIDKIDIGAPTVYKLL